MRSDLPRLELPPNPFGGVSRAPLVRPFTLPTAPLAPRRAGPSVAPPELPAVPRLYRRSPGERLADPPPLLRPPPPPIATPPRVVHAPAVVPVGEPEAAMLSPDVRDAIGKLPQVTGLFWALKMAATTLGETGGDQISEAMHVGFLMTFFIFMGLFLMAVTAQVRAGRLVPALYWTVIVATSAAGTEMADFIFETIGIGYVSGAMAMLVPMAIVWLLGRTTGGSFSVTDITSRRDEVLYWTLILTSNTIGTGVGDGLGVSPLGMWGGTVLIASLMAVVYWAYRCTTVSRVALFWAAFVLTRPLGATGGDLLWKPQAMGGLGLGRIPVSLLLIGAICWMVSIATRQLREREAAATAVAVAA